MAWHDKRVAVVGLGVSNMAVVRHLRDRGATVVGFDQKDEHDLGETAAALRDAGVRLVLGPDYMERLDGTWDAVFVTPGMRKDTPVLAALRERGIPFHSEMGLFLDLCPAPVIGITGSSGKTTTTTLIGEMLRAQGGPVFVGGNIGTPLLDVVDTIPPAAWVVLEMSSFQLEMLDVGPRIAVMTNITPNHLDIHGTMDAYVVAKQRIFTFQRATDLAVYNADDERTAAMGSRAPGRRVGFSRRRRLDAGVSLEGDHIVVGGGQNVSPTKLFHKDDVRLLGAHNLENVLAAVAVAVECGVTPDTMRHVVGTFAGVPHRLERIGQWNGVDYYNDSIATSPARAAAGVRAFSRPVVLIAGGSDKELPFDELADALPGRVHTLVVVGDTAPKIADAVAKARAARTASPLERGAAGAEAAFPTVVRAGSFDEAVFLARDAADEGDVVLLSPACASFDMFPNFAARGRRFRTLVESFGKPQARAN